MIAVEKTKCSWLGTDVTMGPGSTRGETWSYISQFGRPPFSTGEALICASPRPRASLNVSVDRLVSTAAAALEESPKGSGVDDDATKEVFPAQEQVSVPVVVDNDAVPEPTSTPVLVEEPAAIP